MDKLQDELACEADRSSLIGVFIERRRSQDYGLRQDAGVHYFRLPPLRAHFDSLHLPLPGLN